MKLVIAFVLLFPWSVLLAALVIWWKARPITRPGQLYIPPRTDVMLLDSAQVARRLREVRQ